MKEQCPMCHTNYFPPDLRHCPKCGWCLREHQLQDEVERLQCWFAGFFGKEDLAKTPNGWKVDNPRVGWVDAPDWFVQAIQKQESEAADAAEGKADGSKTD